LASLNTPEDVPSPTFTLVQTYDTDGGEIWHADLYRLSDPSEVYELGLEAAFETAICLVEWPDRLGDATPTDALYLTLEIDGDDNRVAHLEWDAQKWNGVIADVQRSFDHGAA
jgi:tRNA threonylcarbamoyladenosine biosynthesis protein TsaE